MPRRVEFARLLLPRIHCVNSKQIEIAAKRLHNHSHLYEQSAYVKQTQERSIHAASRFGRTRGMRIYTCARARVCVCLRVRATAWYAVWR